MRLRPAIAASPFAFGRGPFFVLDAEPVSQRPAIGEEVRLFATTFAAGFLFVTVFLA